MDCLAAWQQMNPLYYTKGEHHVQTQCNSFTHNHCYIACSRHFHSAESEQGQKPVKKQAQERIYGSQLMTRQERAEHRAKMRGLKTQEERDAYPSGAPQENAGTRPGKGVPMAG